jgi:hypothetical protein
MMISTVILTRACLTNVLTQYPVETRSAYGNAVGIAYVSHLEAGRVQLELVEEIEGCRHDLGKCISILAFGLLFKSSYIDLCHNSAPHDDVRFGPLSVLLFMRHDGLQQRVQVLVDLIIVFLESVEASGQIDRRFCLA